MSFATSRPGLLIGLLILVLMTTVDPVVADDSFPYEWKSGTDAGLILGAGAAFGLGWWLDRDFRPFTADEVDAYDPARINVVDRVAARRWSIPLARTSDVLVTGQLFVPLSLPLSGEGSRRPIQMTAMYLETAALTGGVTYLLKNAFDRTRPLVYNPDPRVPLEIQTSGMARKSFPSGHTSSAFSSMVFFATVFEKLNPDSPNKDLVWATCLTSATVAAVLRVTCGRHYPSDVIAGAAIGAFSGWAVPRLHEIDPENPATGGPGKSYSVAWRIGF